MALRPISIPALQERNPIVDEQRRPLSNFIRALNAAFRQIQTAFNENAALLERLAQAEGLINDQGQIITQQQAQIENLQESQESFASQVSLQNSGVVDEVAPMTFGFDGSIIVPAHTRQYGDTTLNPSVLVSGGVTAGTPIAGVIVYVYYDDPARAGGSVSYIATDNPSEAVQTGDRHLVGTGVVPSVGTDNGTYNRPR